MKSKFKGDVEDSDEKVRADSLEVSTNELKAELRDVRNRIRNFASHVDHVVFNQERKDAPWWCPEWQEYLLNGAIPKAPEGEG